MPYVATMTTTLTTDDIDVLKRRLGLFAEALDEPKPYFNVKSFIGKGHRLLEHTDRDGAVVETRLRIEEVITDGG